MLKLHANKMIGASSAPVSRDAMIDKLLNSPMVESLLSERTAAEVRERAGLDLAAHDLKYQQRSEDYERQAREAVERRDAAKAAYETANREAMRLSDLMASHRDGYTQRRIELQRIAKGSPEYLRAKGLI